METKINRSGIDYSLINAVDNNDCCEVERLCIEHPELIGVVDNYNNSPLLYAVNKNNLEIVALLFSYSSRLCIEKGVNIEEYTSIPGIISRKEEYHGQIPGRDIEYKELVTPFMLAIIQKNIPIINIFIINNSIHYKHSVLSSNWTSYEFSRSKTGINGLCYAFHELFYDINTIFKNINKKIKVICQKYNNDNNNNNETFQNNNNDNNNNNNNETSHNNNNDNNNNNNINIQLNNEIARNNIKIEQYYNKEYNIKIRTDIKIINIILNHGTNYGNLSVYSSDMPYTSYSSKIHDYARLCKNRYNYQYMAYYITDLLKYFKIKKIERCNNETPFKIIKKVIKSKKKELIDEITEIINSHLIEKPKKAVGFGCRSSRSSRSSRSNGNTILESINNSSRKTHNTFGEKVINHNFHCNLLRREKVINQNSHYKSLLGKKVSNHNSHCISEPFNSSNGKVSNKNSHYISDPFNSSNGKVSNKNSHCISEPFNSSNGKVSNKNSHCISEPFNSSNEKVSNLNSHCILEPFNSSNEKVSNKNSHCISEPVNTKCSHCIISGGKK